MKELEHDNIIKLYDTIILNDYSLCDIMEYCSGPDLGFFIRTNSPIKENIARIIIYLILKALLYLNKLPNKIIHYDLKPENIIFNDYISIKITDFGLSKIIDKNSDFVQLTSQGVGTYFYLPPECFIENQNVEINTKVDIWSLGVILYEIIYNKKPFGNVYNSQKKLVKDKVILNANFVNFPDEPTISEECKDFIRNCLQANPVDRYDVYQALNSKFIQNSI